MLKNYMHLYNDGHTPFKRKIKGGVVDPYENGVDESKEEDVVLGETKDDPIITDEEIKAELLLKHPPLSRPPPVLPRTHIFVYSAYPVYRASSESGV
jgi:hypothetical protein